MKWYGFVLIFLTAYLLTNFMYAVRLDYSTPNAFVRQEKALPDTSLPLLNGDGEFSAASLPKEPALLFFFASWCRPCLMEFPVIAKLSARHDVPFIGVAVRDKKENTLKLLEKTGQPFAKVGWDAEMDWTMELNASKLPTAFVLNKDGKAVARLNGFLTEEFYLNTVLPFMQELKK